MSAPPRPWILCLSQAWGGLERVALRDAELLRDGGARPRLVVIEDSPIAREAARSGVPLERLASAPRDHFDWELRRRIRGAFREGFGIAHLHQPSLLGSVTPWLPRGMALVVSRHLLTNHRKRSPYHRWIYRKVDRLLVVGEAMRANALDTHPLPPERVRILPLGIDLARFDPRKWSREEARHEAGVTADEFVFGVVGRIDPAKGQRTALEAFSRLPSRARARLWIVGEETRGREGERAVLEERARSLGIASHVRFLGGEPEVPRVLRMFDALLMPSSEEAFGLVAIEGMAMGLPVIVSSSGSGPEIAGTSQKWARLASPEDPESWAREMNFLQENPEASQELAREGQESARSRFDERLRIRRTLDTYSEILFDKDSSGLYT